MSSDYLTNQPEVPVGRHHYRHGRPVSWALVTTVIVAFCVGGIAVVGRWWVVFWVCAGIVVLAVPFGKAIRVMDDTIQVESGPRVRRAITGRDSAADPGVRFE